LAEQLTLQKKADTFPLSVSLSLIQTTHTHTHYHTPGFSRGGRGLFEIELKLDLLMKKALKLKNYKNR
jgi:hypothetical protein